jgi:cbb3-type cytochrome oxidase cytochrome c subunit
MGGVLLLAFVALGSSVALPASDPAVQGKPHRLTRLEAHGIEVYRGEGCWYCHTQYIRNTQTDKRYGKPLDVKAYAGRSPAMLGLERVGSDLTHFGSKGADLAKIMDFLRDPRDVSYKHKFGYLSDSDLRALATYLLSLR